ncbi:MAG: hypothetical protein ACR2H9_02700 [Longimicrobiaceae bacterium]
MSTLPRRRRPTATPLYPLVQQHLETFLADTAAADPDGEGVPRRLSLLQRPSHGGGGRPSHRPRPAAAPVDALPAEADPPLPVAPPHDTRLTGA